jgi:hypothetical protein
VVRKDTIPTFSSYGVATTHDLHLKLGIECAENLSDVNLVRMDIKILPMTRPGARVEETELPVYEEEEGPPPYEE